MMTLEERVFCYRYFSEFFRGTFEPELESNWPVLAEILELKSEGLTLNDSIRRDWARTFYGVGTDTVTLTESTWLNSLRLQCQEPCRQAHEAYAKAGVEPQTGIDHLPDDHVSVLLGFMAWTLQTNPDQQEVRDFFQCHFTGWWSSLIKAAKAYLANEQTNQVLDALESFLAQETARFAA